MIHFPKVKTIPLKPCPFCGGDVYEADIVNDLGICCVMCGNCGADGSAFSVEELGAKFAQRKAIEAWNTRAYKEG